MTGELAALGAALLWAFASILFADIGKYVRAINLNLIKGLFACLLMLIALSVGTIMGIDNLHLQTITSISPNGIILLFVSGIIGIGLGDTAYFACLRRIGPQKGIMLEATAPIIAALLAMFLFQEYLAFTAWLGILLTISGVILVVRLSRSSLDYGTTVPGILFGLVAASSQATGIVLSRLALLAEQVEPLASGLIRLSAALLIIVTWLIIRKIFNFRSANHQQIKDAIAGIVQHKLGLKLLGAITLGTFLAIWLMQTSVKYTSAGIAQTLLATCPLFGMLIGLIRGQTQPYFVWLGLAFGLGGISLLFLH